jgi:ABC-2 type transport system permease protein
MTAAVAAVRAEWIKASTLWSVRLCLLGFALAVVGIGAGVAASIGREEAAEPGYDPGTIAFYGLNVGHVAVIVLAVLLTAGEYARHTIQTSLLAVPRRGVLLTAKLTVGAGLVLPVAAGSAAITVAVTQRLLGSAGVALWAPGVLRSTVAAALYPTLLAVLCMAVGLLLRDQTATLGFLVPFFFLVSPLLELVPGLRRVAVFLPDRAGEVAVRLHGRPIDVFGPLAGLAILAAWAASVALLAWWVLGRRDA